jgi:hypothetical protein
LNKFLSKQVKLAQILYAVSDWKMFGTEGLTIFLSKESALKYYNMDDGSYRYRHRLYVSNGLDEDGRVVWVNITETIAS